MKKINNILKNIVTQNFFYSVFFLVTFFSNSVFSQNDKEKLILPALKVAEYGFKDNYRTFKTTYIDSTSFDKYYYNTEMKLDYVLRYFFHTSIEFSNKQNKLVSMDGTIFELNAKSPSQLVDEIVSLIGNMNSGFNELKTFKKKFK